MCFSLRVLVGFMCFNKKYLFQDKIFLSSFDGGLHSIENFSGYDSIWKWFITSYFELQAGSRE